MLKKLTITVNEKLIRNGYEFYIITYLTFQVFLYTFLVKL